MLAALLLATLQVVTPTDGTTLRGGHFATLTWSAQQLPRAAEEWEAFLSLDGGRYYAVRLTPHLDIRTRTFQVLVPNVDSDDARLLIRTGDERRETVIEMPQRLRIRAEADAIVISQRTGGNGESARPNEPPVVMWSVGDHVVTSATPPAICALVSQRAQSRDIVLTSIRVHRESGGQAILPVRADKVVCPPIRSADVLRQTSRMNV
jgi:hypothetical protein